jgi:hypothetical protein
MYSPEHCRQVRNFGFGGPTITSFSREVIELFFMVWRGSEDLLKLLAEQGMANKRRSKEQIQEIDALIERLRDFVRLNYVTAVEIAREIGVRDSAVGAWLRGEKRPQKPELISTFLDSLPKEAGSGVVPTGYEYREYKNWRGIPKPRRCPFCKRAKGQIQRSRGGFLGVCPNCDASGPKRESRDERSGLGTGRVRVFQLLSIALDRFAREKSHAARRSRDQQFRVRI